MLSPGFYLLDVSSSTTQTMKELSADMPEVPKKELYFLMIANALCIAQATRPITDVGRVAEYS